MDITQRGVAALLISAVTGERHTLPEGFDLAAVYPKLKKHHMDALLYEGALCCGIDKESDVMKVLFQRYCRAFMVSEGQLHALQRLFAAFDANGIDYLPLKGANMKALYRKPELRHMGDADILIRTEQYDRVVPVMEELGFAFQDESDHELQWRSKALFVELHKYLIPTYNEDFYAYFGDGWQFAQKTDGFHCCMSAEDEWVFLFTHFAKHFRDGGVGCRYMVDLWVYLQSHPALQWDVVYEKLERLQLLDFHDRIQKLLHVWFEDGETDELGQVMTDYIFASGSWGSVSSKAASVAVREAKKPVGWRGKLQYFCWLLFPNAASLRGKYPVLKKAPWLLPLIWLYRPFYKLLFERKRFMRRKRALEGLTTENMTERQDFLHAVGLEYHF